jgi:hypothetical protein
VPSPVRVLWFAPCSARVRALRAVGSRGGCWAGVRSRRWGGLWRLAAPSAAVPVPAAVLAGLPAGVSASLRPSSRSLSGWVLVVSGPFPAVRAVAAAWAGRLPRVCRGVVVRPAGAGLVAASVPVAVR